MSTRTTELIAEHHGKTIVITESVHKSAAHRDRHLANGQMAAGMQESYRRLDGLMIELQR